MDETSFSINFDYRCPFARNANEHLVLALQSGAPYSVRFNAFSLTEAHREEGELSVFDDVSKRNELYALGAGVVVREKDPEHFFAAHLSLFAARHDDASDIRQENVVLDALTRAGVDASAVARELSAGWPYETIRHEHETAVKEHAVFGVPTFISNSESVFVRFMHRPNGDALVATRTIARVVELLTEFPELNEYKHTTVPF